MDPPDERVKPAPAATPVGDTTRSLRALRAAVDALDRALIRVLAHRAVAVDAIAALKRARGLPVRDPEREAALLEDRAGYAGSLGLDARSVRALFEGVLAASRARQEGQLDVEKHSAESAPKGGAEGR